VPRRVWKAVEAKIREVRMAEAEGGRKEGRRRKETKRERKEKEETKERKNNRDKEDNRRMENLG